ncbi:hypothetical protein RDABS01_020811 [Bienertia sinuspersici]
MGRKEEIFVKWIAPPSGWIALNSDGAAKGAPGLAGGGGIIRDHWGRMVRAYSANFGICTAYKAELKAVAIGLELMHEMGFMKVIIQMDNAACIQSLLKEDYNGGDCYFILEKCGKLLKFNGWTIELQHCFREGNRVADALANQGVQQTEKLLIFHEIPDGLGSLLNNDIAGVALPRLVNM